MRSAQTEEEIEEDVETRNSGQTTIPTTENIPKFSVQNVKKVRPRTALVQVRKL